MTVAATLRTVPLFSQLRESDLEVLVGLLKPRSCTKNQVILFAHDPCDVFYVVGSGQVKVMLIAEDGREVVLALVGPGDFFGEMALMDDEPYASSVIAMDESRLLALQREDFRRCITDMPGMAFGLLRAFCGRMREADEKIGGLILLDVSGRVARLILQLAAGHDRDSIVELPTHQLISQMVGSSRETVSRTIKAYAAQGMIAMSPRGIRILNHEALETAAGQPLRRRQKEWKERAKPGWPPAASPSRD